MAKQTIGLGAAPNDGTGDPLRTALDKVNDNFDELYASIFLPVGQRSPGAQYYLVGNNEQGTISQVGPTVAAPVRRNRTTSAASSGARAEFAETSRFRSDADLISRYRLVFAGPDASYGSGATGVRICAGLINGSFGDYTTSAADGHASARGAWFRYDTNAGDTNWKLIERLDGTPGNAVVTDTGVAFAAQQLFKVVAVLDGGASPTCTMSIRTYPGGTAYSKNFTYPSAVDVAQTLALRTLDAVARAIDFTDWTLEREAC